MDAMAQGLFSLARVRTPQEPETFFNGKPFQELAGGKKTHRVEGPLRVPEIIRGEGRRKQLSCVSSASSEPDSWRAAGGQ